MRIRYMRQWLLNMTCPPNLGPPRYVRNNIISGEEDRDAQEPVHRAAGGRRAATGGERDPSRGGVSQAGDQRADLLPLEAQVRGHGHRRTAQAAPGRG